MSAEPADPYGRGWAFPPRFDIVAGVRMAEGASDVREAMQILLTTMPGERIMRTNYGCDLEEFLFRNIEAPMTGAITSRVVDAVLEYEPRVVLNAVAVEQNDEAANCITIRVLYRLRDSHDEEQLQLTMNVADGAVGGAS